MTAAATQKKAPAGLSNKAREMMEAINAEAGQHNIWVRTQANAPAQRPWFSETSGEGSGQLASGRVAANQMKTLPHMWQWKHFSPYLHRISEIAQLVEYANQPRSIAAMQTDGRLVQNVERAHQSRSQRGGQLNALRLAAGQR